MRVMSKGTLIDRKFQINDGEIVDLPEGWKTRPGIANNVGKGKMLEPLGEELNVEQKKQVIGKKTEPEYMYTRSEVKGLNKGRQVQLLKKYGVKEEHIKKIKTEEKRIDKILQLQKLAEEKSKLKEEKKEDVKEEKKTEEGEGGKE